MKKTSTDVFLGFADNDDIFGPDQTIDNIEGVAGVVADIVETTDPEEPEPTVQYDLEQVQLAAGIVREYIRRTRLLTIAVVAIVLYLVLKEIS